jgi:hypothetical protein
MHNILQQNHDFGKSYRLVAKTAEMGYAINIVIFKLIICLDQKKQMELHRAVETG